MIYFIFLYLKNLIYLVNWEIRNIISKYINKEYESNLIVKENKDKYFYVKEYNIINCYLMIYQYGH